MADDPRDDQQEAPDEEPKAKGEGFGQRLEGFVPEVLRRAFYSSLGAVFASEEGIKKLANDFSLPRDVANYLVAQAQGSREQMLRIVGNEMRRFLESINLHDELQRLLTSISFEIKTEIRFIPNDKQTPRPKLTQKVKMKRVGKDKDKDKDNGGNGDDGDE
ncbi:MAG: hypothetical protein KC503_02325 [Myxococcales bacterium]|nr:hypothetical protein [Myxococcales bacterium]